MPVAREDCGSSYSGVLPSRRVTTRSSDCGTGRSSRNRHTPLRSRDSFNVRRSRQSDFRATGLREFQDESVISSRLPHSEHRKSCAAEPVIAPQPMQRKRNVAWPGLEPVSEVVEEGMDEMNCYFWPRRY